MDLCLGGGPASASEAFHASGHAFMQLGQFVDAKNWLKGHAVGVYAGAGYYDYQRLRSGYQGEYVDVDYTFGLPTGPAGNRWMRLEFNVGLGWIRTWARHYTPTDDYSELIRAPTITDGVANPTVILAPSDVSSVYSNDWLWTKNDDLWGNVSGRKTIYDPCPYGYKVPDEELQTVLEEFSSGRYSTDFEAFGASYDADGVYLFFPYAGWKGDDVRRASRTHAWMKVGQAGDYMDARFDSGTFHRSRSLITDEAFDVVIYGSNVNEYSAGLNSGYTNRTAAASVRCIRYDGEPSAAAP